MGCVFVLRSFCGVFSWGVSLGCFGGVFPWGAFRVVCFVKCFCEGFSWGASVDCFCGVFPWGDFVGRFNRVFPWSNHNKKTRTTTTTTKELLAITIATRNYCSV